MVIRLVEALKSLREVGSPCDWEIAVVKLAGELVDSGSLLPIRRGDLHFAEPASEGVGLSHGNAAVTLCPTTSGIDRDHSPTFKRERETARKAMNFITELFVRNGFALCAQPLQIVLKIDYWNWLATANWCEATIGVHASTIWILPMPHLQKTFF
jgi:hypothetical protein